MVTWKERGGKKNEKKRIEKEKAQRAARDEVSKWCKAMGMHETQSEGTPKSRRGKRERRRPTHDIDLLLCAETPIKAGRCRSDRDGGSH